MSSSEYFKKTEESGSLQGYQYYRREIQDVDQIMIRISRGIEQRNRFTGITEVHRFPGLEVNFPLRGTLADARVLDLRRIIKDSECLLIIFNI